jgi:proton-dependent oligopeptide transporter, POT family
MQQLELSTLPVESSRRQRVDQTDSFQPLEMDEDLQAEDKPLMAPDSSPEDVHSFPNVDASTLPRVSDKIPWRVYTVAFVELCERFSNYGTTILFQNFVQRNLLTPTGRAPNPGGDTDNNPGALGQGQQTATALSIFFSFWSQTTPLWGAWLADTYLGR